MRTMMRLAGCVLFSAMLAACGGSDDAGPAAPAAVPPSGEATPAPPPQPEPAVAPADPATPAPAPEQTAPAGTGSVTGFHGFGPARFGDDEESVRIAWGRPMNFDPAPTADAPCAYLVPETGRPGVAPIAFMFDGERFVRYDVRDAQYEAPGSARVGNTLDALQALYPQHELMPHKYIEGGRYFVVAAPASGESKLVFELDAGGTVTAWRVGLPPQVDFVEGCS